MSYKQQVWEAYHHRFGLAGEGQADIIQNELERRPGSVLTVGCGFLGDKIDNIAKHCLLLIAADRSVQVVEQATINVIQRNVHLLAADVQQLPFTSDSFEHILALGLFAYIPEPSTALKELRRVCHSGGTVMITNAVRHPREPLRVAAASAGFDVLREHEGYCPAASGKTKRRYLIALVARNRTAGQQAAAERQSVNQTPTRGMYRMERQNMEFTFVQDEHVRFVLEDYYGQAVKASTTAAHLGVIVACGSVVEGLLTWALLQRKEMAMRSSKACKDKQGQAKPLEEWNLSNLIDVSVELELIGKTAKQASWALKDFRNFIHPYNVLKQSARPDAALASSAMAALSEIRRSLEGKLSK